MNGTLDGWLTVCQKQEKMTQATNSKAEYIDILQKKTFAEFFAGIGLMRLGLEKEGWTVAYANDIAADKFEMYSDNFPNAKTHFSLGDIHQLNVEDVPTVTLATASFPMQRSFSGRHAQRTCRQRVVGLLGIRAGAG